MRSRVKNNRLVLFCGCLAALWLAGCGTDDSISTRKAADGLNPVAGADQDVLVGATVQLDGEGPWQVAGGELPPVGAALVYQGPEQAEPAVLSPAQREQLEALGYLQGEP